MTTVPRPITKLTDDQQRLLAAAIEAARESKTADQRAAELKEITWRRILEARNAGVPDEPLCDETGFSRATLNRRFGPRREADES